MAGAAQVPSHPHYTPAGTLLAHPHATASTLDVFAFGPDGMVEKQNASLEWIAKSRSSFTVMWVNVDGLGDVTALSGLGAIFDLHKLSMEDVLTRSQRPKFEGFPGYHLIVLRMLFRHHEVLNAEQLSVFLGKDFVITFQEGVPGDCLGPLRTRLRAEVGWGHNNLASFLAYSIIDNVVDSYFPILEKVGDYLEDLEEEILSHPTPDTVRGVHDVKRELLIIRRAVWPLREAISPLFHDQSSLVGEETKVFLRDCHDHCIQIIDLVETYREIGSSLMDVYLSSLSNRMNEVMKVLTIITTIFVPLTFVAGVYGMNFNTEASPLNMPELNFYWGYPLCLGGMLAVALLELWTFRRRGWIFRKEGPARPRGAVSAQAQDQPDWGQNNDKGLE